MPSILPSLNLAVGFSNLITLFIIFSALVSEKVSNKMCFKVNSDSFIFLSQFLQINESVKLHISFESKVTGVSFDILKLPLLLGKKVDTG